jgi:uncharacterized protein YdiU (UPF0061 family)
VLEGFSSRFEANYSDGIRQKLGLSTVEDGDIGLAGEFLGLLATNQVDFTIAFRRLSDAADDIAANDELRSLFQNRPGFDAWWVRWRERLAREPETVKSRRERLRSIP